MSAPDYATLDSGRLMDALIDVATERGILMATDAPDEELHEAQRRIDQITAELHRHLAW